MLRLTAANIIGCRSCLTFQVTSSSLIQLTPKSPPSQPLNIIKRWLSSKIPPNIPPQSPWNDPVRRRQRAIAAYIVAAVTGMFGLAYAGVPLYRIYCQATGTGTKSELAKSSGDRVKNA